MTIDHAGALLSVFYGETKVITGMHYIGRLSYPIYIYLIYNGLLHTKDKYKYFRNLCLVGFLSQIPYSLLFESRNYTAGDTPFLVNFPDLQMLVVCGFFSLILIIYFHSKMALLASSTLLLGCIYVAYKGYTLCTPRLNVMFGLAGAVTFSIAYDYFKKKKYTVAVMIFLYALMLLINADYYFANIIIVAMLLLLPIPEKIKRVIPAIVMGIEYVFVYEMPYYVTAMIIVCIPLLLYNGKKGKNAKWVFYYYYPVHLAILSMIMIVCNTLAIK